MADGGDSMPSLIMQAAQSAAQADGLLPNTNSSGSGNNAMGAQQQQALAQARLAVQNARAMQMQQQQQGFGQSPSGGGGNSKKKGPPLRRGKWTPEEEAYANRLIQEFKAGLLPLTDGTTLRTFLSKLLNCDPMRISKKFVGSNCIGKQVFRRRTADLNRLTPEQIAQSRAELSELERRFLERVAQTNRVKSSGVGSGGNGASNTGGSNMMSSSFPVGKNALDNLAHQHQQQHQQQQQQQQQQMQQLDPPSPPWLQPPRDYKHGEGAALAAASSRSAAAGRALLGSSFGSSSSNRGSGGFGSGSGNTSSDLLAELQRRASNHSMLNAFQQSQSQSSTSNLLAAAAARSGSGNGLGGNSSLSLSQFSRNLSASRLAGLGGNSSMNELMLKTGLSRDQLSSLARDRSGLSSGSLSNMIQRQNSFDALMSLDFQSIQSIDNLANLIQSGGGGNVPESGIRNADFGTNQMSGTSSGDLSHAARRLASQGRMESLLRNLSSHNMRDGFGSGGSGDRGISNANLSNLLQSMQNMQNADGGSRAAAANASMASLFGGGNGSSGGFGGNQNNSVSLADLLRQDSSTGLTALRMQDGLTQRNSSVDDFLSLVAAGDIPHQDPSLLNVPLMQQQQQHSSSQSDAAAKFLSSQSSLHQSNPALANALASRSFGNFGSDGGGGNNFSSDMLQQFAQQQMSSSSGNKRKIGDLDMISSLSQSNFKR